MIEPSSDENGLLFIGLPGSGKSTFLGALAGSIEHADYTGRLQFSGYPEERALLEQLITDWLQCNTVGRTKGQQPFPNTLHLTDSETGSTILLNVPDLSGEIFDRQCERRDCSTSYVEAARATDRVMLFCHAGRNYRNEPIPPSEATDDDDKLDQLEVKWNPEHVALGAKLVDLLQMLFDLRQELPDGKLRIALVVSAWDILDHIQSLVGFTPESFVKENIALLYQFLDTHRDKIDFEFFGVSAQGADYEDKQARKRLLEGNPLDRISVVQGTVRDRDLAIPVKWLIR